MKTLYPKVAATAVFSLLIICGASSKAPLSKLSISGGKLSKSVEILDPDLLEWSNPWSGKFIQWNMTSAEETSAPPESAPRYEIDFYATFSPKEPPHIVYVAYYAFDPATQRGFVYLPGAREQWHSTNASSILRPHQDGRWNVADREWCGRMNAVISRAEGEFAGH